MRVFCILVTGVLGFFWEEDFRGETFLFFNDFSSSLGGGTSPFYCPISAPSISLLSPPLSGVIEAVLKNALSTS
jgi:hypothetical protein